MFQKQHALMGPYEQKSAAAGATGEVKTLVEEIKKNFEDFKQYNDRRLAEIEKKGASDAQTEETLKHINDAIEANQAALAALTAQTTDVNAQVEEMQKSLSRKGLNGGDGADQSIELEVKQMSERAGRTVTVDEVKAYRSSFRNYVRRNNARGSVDEIKALSVGSDADGGFLVPADTSGRIVKLVMESSPMRQVANVVTISTDALEGINDLYDLSSGWVGETEARNETTTPKIGEYRIPVHEQYAEPRATQKLLDDASFDVEAWLVEKIADRLSRMENAAFISGNGERKPRGFLTYAAGTPSASAFNVIEQIATGQSAGFAGTDPGDALIKLVFALKAAYRENACFMMKRATLAEVRKLKDGQGNYLWQPDFEMRQGGKLLGFDIVEAEDMPSIAANSLSIAFGDFKAGYQIVDRQGIRVLRDSFTAKPYVKFYTTKRVGGDVVNFEAIKLLKFGA